MNGVVSTHGTSEPTDASGSPTSGTRGGRPWKTAAVSTATSRGERIPGPISPSATTPAFSSTRSPTGRPTARASSTCRSRSRDGPPRNGSTKGGAMSEETIRLEVTRYRPGHDNEPRIESFAVPYEKDWVVLDALNHIKDQMDGSLTYRWSCRMGVCGSCGMMVNGVPRLTCSAFLRDYHPGPIRVEPL